MTSVSTLGQSVDQISRLLRQQSSFENLSTQLATGKKIQQFSELGTDLLRTKRARADINSLQQYSDNITNSNRRIKLMSDSIELLSSQVGEIVGGLRATVQGGDAPDFETMQKLASDVYDFALDLINTMDGDRFLFAGSDSRIKPIEDKGIFDSFLGGFVPDEADITNSPLQSSGFIGDWGSGFISTEEFIQTYSNVNDHVLGYSDALASGTTGKVSVRVDDNSDFDYTVLGNDQAMKDMVIALGVLKNMPPPEFAPGALNDPSATVISQDTPPFPSSEKQENFYAVLNDLTQRMAAASDGAEQHVLKLSLVQAQTDAIKEYHGFQINSFESLISEVEDADITEVSVQIQRLQTTIQASYSVTALAADLSLVNFL